MMGKVDIDFSKIRKVVEASEEVLGQVNKAGILPAEAYVDDEFWNFEKEALFSKEWLCIGHVNEVPNEGDHLPLNVLDEPLLIVRGQAGKVRVLSAVCQHRGHPIVGGVKDMPEAGKCLNARALICPYHAWTYNLDGTLRGAPAMESIPLAELKENNSLREIRSEIFHGLVFITFNQEITPVSQKLAKLDAELNSYGLKDLMPGRAYAQTGLNWNWKLHHENALEPYHTSYVHRGFHNAVPSNLTKFYEFDGSEGSVFRTTGFESTDGDLFEYKGTRRLPPFSGLTEEQRGRVMFVSIMPCVVAVLQPSVVTITFLNPTSADRLNSRRINFYSKEASEQTDFETIEADLFNKMKLIVEQDAVTQKALQHAYVSRYKPRGRLANLETAIMQLNQWVVTRYRDGLKQLEASEVTDTAA